MGNTSSSHKDPSTDTPRAEADHDFLLVPLRERFEELAGPPTAPQNGEDPAAGAGGAGGGQEGERFVFFDNWSQLGGPRGAQVAARLYGVLDAGGDGKLDFQEFSSASCLLKGSPDESKIALLFKMYGEADKGGLVGREGLKAFILDMIAAADAAAGTGGGGLEGEDADGTDLEVELEHLLARMAGVVLTEYDADSDGMLTEKEWRAYLKREEESVSAFLKTLSDSVGKLLVP
eukprot:jgi/Undpi1/6021/HiC_scaffold_2.g01295.m1